MGAKAEGEQRIGAGRQADALAAAYARISASRWDRFPRVLSRWSLSHLWYRMRLPIRRRRWDRRNRALAQPYLKAATPAPVNNQAVALGEFSARTGLGQGARNYLLEVQRRHGDVTVVDVGPGLARPGEVAPVSLGGPVGYVYILCQPDGYAAALSMLRPEEIASARRTGALAWETPQFPDAWSYTFDLVHGFWAPSAFSALGARSAGASVEVIDYPMAIDMGARPLPRARFGVPEDAFLGIAIMDLQSCPARKNPLGHVLAWKRAFGDDPNHVLLMKLRFGKRTGVIRDEILALAPPGGNVRLVEEEFSRAEIGGFQRMADVYLSLHRSEGYGLNIRECLAYGVPVVATHWSANTEFGPASPLYHGIGWRMIPYHDWLNHYGRQRFEWADPDLGEAAATLRRLAIQRPGNALQSTA